MGVETSTFKLRKQMKNSNMVELLARSSEDRAFKEALRLDALSECATEENYIEHFDYLGRDGQGQHVFKHKESKKTISVKKE